MNVYDRFKQLAAKRNARMVAAHERGQTFAEIGRRFGVTRQRAQQIITAASANNRGK